MPDRAEQRTGVLVIRAWMAPEQHEMIARVTGRLDVSRPDEISATAAGAAEATRLAGDWLAAFEQGAAGDPP